MYSQMQGKHTQRLETACWVMSIFFSFGKNQFTTMVVNTGVLYLQIRQVSTRK